MNEAIDPVIALKTDLRTGMLIQGRYQLRLSYKCLILHSPAVIFCWGPVRLL
jgi:hypothetical protein